MKIFFAVLILICAVFYIMYLWDFAIVLLIVVMAVPVLMLIMGLVTKHSIRVKMLLDSTSASKNHGFTVQLLIENRCIFPVGRAITNIEYFNCFDGKKNSFCLLLPIQERNSQSVAFKLSSKFCGMLNIRCSHITIYDPLKVFKFKVNCNIVKEIPVLPEGHEIGGQICFTDRTNDESSLFSEHKPGDDPSEIFDLRGYNPGDKLNRIHWKLSSKKDDFIVKDYSLPIDIPCTVFLDLTYDNSSEYAMPVYDTLVETLISISTFMLENERRHHVVFFNARNKCFTEKDIKDMDSLAEAVQTLISSSSGNIPCQSPSVWFADKGYLSLSSFIFISASPESSVMEYIDDSVDADIKNALLVVPSAEKACGLAAGYADICTIPVIIGRISSSVKDIEI